MLKDGCSDLILERSAPVNGSGWARDDVCPTYGFNKESRLYTSCDVEDVFDCVSRVCTLGGPCSPHKSDPRYRSALPLIKLVDEPVGGRPRVRSKFSFHLPPDYRFLYPAAPLAYYFGASIETDEEPHIAFRSAEPMRLPGLAGLEEWMGDMLRRAFYLDCAVRHARFWGETLNGMGVQELLGREADEVFDMDAGDRLMLYEGLKSGVPELPAWHMEAHLDPVAESVEALPFLLRPLSAIYMPRCMPVTERALVSRAVHEFLGGQSQFRDTGAVGAEAVVLPAFHGAGSKLWFSGGFPVAAAKSSVRAFLNRRKYAAVNRRMRVGVICNDPAMEEEVDAIIDALSDAPISLQVYWNSDISGFHNIFARGFDIVQLIGHCDDRGFRCHDGPALIEDIGENRTPMFFFNSCSSYREAARLIDKGSVCGVATFFRVLEEAAVDVCRNFYLLLGEGYTASMAMGAAMECSVLGKEYLLLGDGSYDCFGRGDIRRLYRVFRNGKAYRLGCTMSNTDKGYVVRSWSAEGEKAVSDLGFETGDISGEHLASIAPKFDGCCIYGRSIYKNVEEAVLKAREDELEPRRSPAGYRRGRTRRYYG